MKSWVLNERQRTLIEANLHLADWYIYHYSRIHANVALDELREIAYLALCKAAHCYDPQKSKFSTYAKYAIKNEITDFLCAATSGQVVLSLDEVVKQDSKQLTTFAELIADPKQEQLFREIENRDLLERTMRKLKGKQRYGLNAIVLKMQGYSYTEISNKAGKPLDYTKSAIQDVRKILRSDPTLKEAFCA